MHAASLRDYFKESASISHVSQASFSNFSRWLRIDSRPDVALNTFISGSPPFV